MRFFTFVKKFLLHSLSALLGITASAAIVTPANAFSIYFGSNSGWGEKFRLPSHPNADNARNQFLANLVGVGTENFESFVPGSIPPLAINFPGAGTATLTDSGSIQKVTSGTNGRGRYPVSGVQYFDTNSAFAITFSQEVAAFGFYGIDIGDFQGKMTLTLEDTLNGFNRKLTVDSTVNGPGGSVLYYGLIAGQNELFNKITFGNTAPGVDLFGFDDMTIGS